MSDDQPIHSMSSRMPNLQQVPRDNPLGRTLLKVFQHAVPEDREWMLTQISTGLSTTVTVLKQRPPGPLKIDYDPNRKFTDEEAN